MSDFLTHKIEVLTRNLSNSLKLTKKLELDLIEGTELLILDKKLNMSLEDQWLILKELHQSEEEESELVFNKQVTFILLDYKYIILTIYKHI